MDRLSDDDLLEAYFQACKLELDSDFIQLLEQELQNRSISVTI